jgi:hypothetical protein
MNLKSLRTLGLILCSVLIDLNVKAQNGNQTYFTPTIFPASPNSASFAKYGNYEVNLYSGLPDISIPLYTVEAGGLKVPVVLSYHASGNKIADVASSVGLGWSVNTGGLITRAINGLPDENGYLNGNLRSSASIHPDANNNDIDWLRQTVELREWDNMPDIFSYQVPGYSGRFFFDGTNKYKIETVPFSNLKITGGINGFHVTDDHGTIFGLGYTYKEVTGTPRGGGMAPLNGTSAWMLEQMISQNKRDTINFSYSSVNFTYPDALTENQVIEDSYTQVSGSVPSGWVNSVQPPEILNNPSIVTQQQLSTITFRNGRVDFVLDGSGRLDVGNNGYSSTTMRKLDTIKVSGYNFTTKKYEVQKSIVFFTSYFNQGIAGKQRLKLDSIEVLDKAMGIAQHYRFTYNTTVNLPAYGSYARDFWGYYNGQDNVTDLIPQTSVQYVYTNGTISNITIGSSSPTSRNPDSTKMQADMLTRIDYPTGGYSVFTYQTNQYYDSNHNLQLAGGLRVNSIKSYPNQSSVTLIVKTYQYNKARPNFINITDGAPINLGIFTNTQTYRWWNSTNSSQEPNGIVLGGTKRVRNFTANPNQDLAPDGIPVAYSNVTEYLGTPTNNIGKNVYSFRDGDGYYDSWQTAFRTGIEITYNYSFWRGKLLNKKSYKRNSDGSYQKVKEESNGYSAFPLRHYGAVGLAVGQYVYNDGILGGGSVYPSQLSNSNDVNSYPFENYDILSDDNYLTGTTTKLYDANDTTKFTTTSATYAYDDTTHQEIINTSHVDSKGNTRKTINKFAYNYIPNGSSTTGNAVLDSMVNQHIYAEPIEKNETYTTGATTTTTAGQLNTFRVGTISGTVVPGTVNVLNIPTPVTNFAPSSVVSGNLTWDSRYVQMISFDQYDPKNNIAQYTPRNLTPVSILWDYNYEKPVAQIKNATNGSSTQIGYTSFEAPRTTGLWTYAGTPVYDVTAPTGNMSYPLSSGSVTTTNLDGTQSYVLSMWSNNGAPTVYIGSYLTGTPSRTMNGWTYYEYAVPASITGITISGTASIDELRLYPVAAQMTTYAYDPSGLRSITDTKGMVSYFEYDPFQRLKNIKDWNGNIVKNFGYHTYDQLATNDAIAATTFTRDNCPAGTNPQSTTYSVPAGKYFSSTKASANAEAQYDLKVNGQAKADNPAICGCPVQTVDFTLTNSTGLSGFTATFSGISPPFPFPPSGSTVIHVPIGNYSVYIGPVGSYTHTFKYGFETQSDVHYATFNDVTAAASGGNATTLSIQ